MLKEEMKNLKSQLKDFRNDMKKALVNETNFQFISEDSIYYIIEQTGNSYTINYESTIEEIENINLRKIDYIQYKDGSCVIDSELGDLYDQIDMTEDFDKLNEYMNTVEYKFNTEWSKNNKVRV